MQKNEKAPIYNGFEQGPIRPPSEAYSLLIRITRNCPWNRCTFCPVYKGSKFSIRPLDHIIKDINMVHKYVKKIGESGIHPYLNSSSNLETEAQPQEWPALQAALNWTYGGMKSIFIQDANSLIIQPRELIQILHHLKTCFPWVERITSYARSHTIARIHDNDLIEIRDAGLNRIHIGLESGSDDVLKRINKGVNKETHIKAGLKVKDAGIELSEYIMPGLGGRKLWESHALETADTLNKINPDFIRLRTLSIPNKTELYQEYLSGEFERCSDSIIVKEILLFIKSLEKITSQLKSDHILNLLQELEGKFPNDKEHMIKILKSFLDLSPKQQCLFQVGRRLGIFTHLSDLNIPKKYSAAESICHQYGVTPANIDTFIEEATKHFL